MSKSEPQQASHTPDAANISPEAQRKAIAEACGAYKTDVIIWRETYYGPKHDGTRHSYLSELPDYLSDLNAMNEAEKVLTITQREDYVTYLSSIYNRDSRSTIWWVCVHATAAQRAEAFLRTLNLWDESK